MTPFSIFIGYDPRELAAFAVVRSSIRHHMKLPVPIQALRLDHLRACGLFYRPTRIIEDKIYDDISEAFCATEFSNSRFLVPTLAQHGYALFMDPDMLVMTNLAELFHGIDPEKAVTCVKHQHAPVNSTKMDGQIQQSYARKNWSSVMVFNCDHPANARLTVELVNSVPGRDLHAFCWLQDDEIGELGPEWNYLVGHTRSSVTPKIIHFTDGTPNMPGYENCEYANEWRAAMDRFIS